MTSVERLKFFDNIPQESATTSATTPAAALALSVGPGPQAWPARGAIEVDKLSMRYRPGLPLVLDRVSFSVAAGERVGVVGRTGSGKSSLVLALFRICEPCGGAVRIDGVDCGGVDLARLRSSLSIIPQVRDHT
jgi:ABC-type multidrug transport system fused ATPase/permease subunit